MISGGITPFMHPETMTATIEVRVIEGMTRQDVPNELRSALAQAGLADRVQLALAGPPHDWVPPSSAAGATRLIDSAAAAHRPDEWIPAADYPACTDLAEALVRVYTTP
jgi:acetylornithine deacetylase/succinyl-diaminopimelate desuccinylase-like protein